MVIPRTSSHIKSNGPDLKIVQFNTLADTFAGPHFLNVKDSNILQWDVRKQQLIDVITFDDPDVICLEEVDHFEDFFLPQLQSKGYSGKFVKKAAADSRDGLAMFHKTNRLKAVNENVISYEGQNQNAIITVFDVTHEGSVKQVCVCVTHLKAKSAFAEVRTKEVQQLIKEISTSHSHLPTIICGDFNDVPDSTCYKLMTNHGLSSAYAHKGAEPAFTTYKDYEAGEKKQTIDYIFYTNNSLELVSILELIPETSLPTKLPCAGWPSDHLSLHASFSFKST